MGYVTIPLDGITPGTPVDKWYPVKPRKSKDKVSGEIHVYYLYSQSKVTRKRSLSSDTASNTDTL